VHEAAAQARSDGASQLLHTGYKVGAKRVAHNGQEDVDGEMQGETHACESAPNGDAGGRGKAEQHVGNEEHVPGDEGTTAAGQGTAVAVQVAVAALAIKAGKRYDTTCLPLCTRPKAKEANGQVQDGQILPKTIQAMLKRRAADDADEPGQGQADVAEEETDEAEGAEDEVMQSNAGQGPNEGHVVQKANGDRVRGSAV
jgi:hypothetical protein